MLFVVPFTCNEGIKPNEYSITKDFFKKKTFKKERKSSLITNKVFPAANTFFLSTNFAFWELIYAWW